MIKVTVQMREFAERLIAQETTTGRTAKATTPTALAVLEKLRPPLAMLMGNVGFSALLSRALDLAHPEVPWLRGLRVDRDGSVVGLEEPAGQVEPDERLRGATILLARLLELLVTFIGEGLTLRLMREVWPKLDIDTLDSGKGAKK